MSTETKLYYNAPAEDFNSALPVGNGRIGGMIFGGAANEVIKLNEDSIWSGGLRNRINPDAQEGLAEVRKLLTEGDISGAEKTAFQKLQGVTPESRHYMPLGNLYIDMKLDGKVRDYSRSLDISTAAAEVNFRVEETVFKREVFVSAPDEVMIVRITASQPGKINLTCGIDGRDGYYDDNRPIGENMLLCNGGTGSKDGIFFACAVGAKAKGGKLRTIGGKISAENADEVMIAVSVRTSFYSENYDAYAEVDGEMALDCDYDELYYRHVSDYQEYFNRVELNLNDNCGEEMELPTDERIARLRGNELDDRECQRHIHDNKLIELYFNYARYLMISASRPKTQAMNIQGIWNQDMQPAWGSRYTLNVNTEMNYWIAESCNLSEFHRPLFDLLERICVNGRKTAKEMYGIDKGFVCHHNTDIWGDTAPHDLWMPATIWPMGGAWLALHIFQHYEYTLDKDFLSEKYYLMKEAAEFFTEYLIEDKEGRLVTSPSVSPENTYITESGKRGSLCMGPSMDSQIITVLFESVIKSAEILGIDSEFAELLREKLKKLPRPEVGKYGQIKEWAEDYNELDAGHRHISQLFALHPAELITPDKTPKLANAARATLIRRLVHGGGHTGWSCAWIANMWARLYDGKMVYEYIKRLLASSTNPNLLDTNPPFQIDGNFGGASAITEALLQCCDGEIKLLPALPDTWSEGHIYGLRAKGGFGVDIEWQDGKLTRAEITSDKGGECRIRANCVVSILCGEENIDSRTEGETVIFTTIAGNKYIVKA